MRSERSTYRSKKFKLKSRLVNVLLIKTYFFSAYLSLLRTGFLARHAKTKNKKQIDSKNIYEVFNWYQKYGVLVQALTEHIPKKEEQDIQWRQVAFA